LGQTKAVYNSVDQRLILSEKKRINLFERC